MKFQNWTFSFSFFSTFDESSFFRQKKFARQDQTDSGHFGCSLQCNFMEHWEKRGQDSETRKNPDTGDNEPALEQFSLLFDKKIASHVCVYSYCYLTQIC